MKISILTLFPNLFDNFKTESIIKRAIDKGLVEIEVINIRDFNNSMNTSVFIKEPVVQNNSLVYGVSMSEKGAHSQFYFTLVNKGDKELKIDKIHIEGLENYGRYVKVNLVGINENDLLPPYSEVNVKVTTDYEEELEKSEISINNIKITIDYKE